MCRIGNMNVRILRISTDLRNAFENNDYPKIIIIIIMSGAKIHTTKKSIPTADFSPQQFFPYSAELELRGEISREKIC